MVRNGLRVSLTGAQVRELLHEKRENLVARKAERDAKAEKLKAAGYSSCSDDGYNAAQEAAGVAGIDLFCRFLKDEDEYHLDHDDLARICVRP